MNTLQVKILAAILAVLLVIVAEITRGGPRVVITAQDRQEQTVLEQKVMPSAKPYLVP